MLKAARSSGLYRSFARLRRTPRSPRHENDGGAQPFSDTQSGGSAARACHLLTRTVGGKTGRESGADRRGSAIVPRRRGGAVIRARQQDSTGDLAAGKF